MFGVERVQLETAWMERLPWEGRVWSQAWQWRENEALETAEFPCGLNSPSTMECQSWFLHWFSAQYAVIFAFLHKWIRDSTGWKYASHIVSQEHTLLPTSVHCPKLLFPLWRVSLTALLLCSSVISVKWTEGCTIYFRTNTSR
jgi:hypothetical protein